MTAPLRACPGCSRHVRVSEPACPFCGGELDGAFRSTPSPRVPAVGRLSRAALFAVGAGGIAAGSACGSMTEQAYGGAACEGNDCIPYVAADASVEAAPDGAPNAATGDAAVDSAGDVQAQPGDASTDAACLMRVACYTLYGACPVEWVPCEPVVTDAGDASPEQ
jgi:hypothetical protein